MSQSVTVRRTDLPTPSLDDPTKVTVQVEYRVGELPPRFLYLDKKLWTKEKEAELIKADLKRRMEAPGEVITI